MGKADQGDMGMKTIIVIVLICTSPTLCLADSPVVEKPVYHAGELWVFIKDSGEKMKLEFLRTEGDSYVFLKNGKKEVIRDATLSDVERKSQGRYPGPILEFPLHVGKTWRYSHKAGKYSGPDITKRTVERSTTFIVESYEEITVPAGTFQAFKIVATVESESSSPGILTGSHMYWYAPEVRQIVKSSEYRVGTWELRKFKVKE